MGLSQAVNQAPVGNVTGATVKAGSFTFSQPAFSVGQDGTAAPGSEVTVIRTGGNSGPVTVSVALSSGSATTEGVDYWPGPIEIVFGDDEISKTVDLSAVLIVNPAMRAGATLNLSLSLAAGSPVAASLGSQDTAVVNLISIGSPGIFSFGSGAYSVHEDGTPVTPVLVTRSGGSAGEVTVIVTPFEIPGGAVAGRDFVATPIELTFTDGNLNRVVSIPILQDSLLQASETFGISLSLQAGAPARSGIGSVSGADVTILPPPPVPAAVQWGTKENVAVCVPEAKVVANAKNLNTSGALSITAVNPNSVQGGTVALSGGRITYTPPRNYLGADQFTYTLSDGVSTAQGTVSVTITPGPQPVYQPVIICSPGSQTVKMSWFGIPNQLYVVQSKTLDSVTGSWTDWADIPGVLVTASALGQIDCADNRSPLPTGAMYRLRIGP
jgi:hypothetical protein